jgi:hypothetical protein
MDRGSGKFRRRLGTITAALLLHGAALARAQQSTKAASLTGAEIVAQMAARNHERAQALKGYHGRRHYHLNYSGVLGERQADMTVEVRYQSPGEKQFTVLSESGSKWICHHVLRRLMQVEQENARRGTRESTEISPENYQFALESTEVTPSGSFYVLGAMPRTENQYLFRGRIWVDTREFAVARIVGEPAKNPSRWTRRNDFRHDYERVGDFWLPARNETLTQLYLLGKSRLTIEYTDYTLTDAERGPPEEDVTPLPSPPAAARESSPSFPRSILR